ncbi:tyrosine-protein phosphatase [Novisyntrophococcus fermenticellae]|uniref:tyrosine-protein phosphatase n=1 Tax=Novisyntrophococcus fermenticellae TaxID=2068655 RepID=UPI001E435D0C|nr:tyrosine-protein phosphatase [Novisyntrophococcus fermenticellae]
MDISKIQGKLLDIEGAFNVRELGGYKNSRGQTIQRQCFIRSGSLGGLTQRGIEALLDYGVDCIIDLRSLMEAEKQPDILAKHDKIKYYHVPMLDNVQSNISSEISDMFPESLEAMYQGLIDNSYTELKRAFEIFSDTQNNCVLFHCSAGKDRTGISAALLLGLAGVDYDTIAEDYSWTQHLLPASLFENMPFQVPEFLFESNPEAMRTTLAYIDRRYGGVDSFLSKIGVTDTEKENIRNKMFA